MDAETATLDYLTKEGEGEEDEEEEFSYIQMLDKPRILPEPVDLTFEHLKEIGYELGLVDLCWPEEIKPIFEDRTNFPVRYVSNTEKEKVLLLFTKNFRKKFYVKYPNRKQLFLARENECGILKVVCTAIRPTALPYPEFEVWNTCAHFVGDHIKFETLEDSPTKIPNRLYSPHTTMLRQSGTSFEIATVLCSLLIGVGYDAYVVSGYANKDIALRIMVRVDCPFPPFKEVEEKRPEPPKIEKYVIVPPNDHKSKFLQMLDLKEQEKLALEEAEAAEQERLRLLTEEKRPLDELEGQRVHAWVLIKAGSRNIEVPFFVEPTTGVNFRIDGDKYLGIESIWNHQQYWVNLQDCSNGLGKIDFNFTDNEKWIHLLASEPYELRQRREVELKDEEINRDMYEEKHLDMPTSWSLKLHLPHDRLKKRFPDGGCRITNFKRVLVEQYANFASPDGLTKRLTRYRDFECAQPYLVEEEYDNRQDRFYRSMYDHSTELVTDYFSPGREDSVIKHIYSKNSDEIDAHRVIFFDFSNRGDHLFKLEVEADRITETFKERHDRLYYRQVTYLDEEEKVPLRAGFKRNIFTIVQKYERDESKASNEDIAIREFAILEREIRIKYHYGANNVTASTRVFIKPAISDWGEELPFRADLTYGYQAEVHVKSPRQVELFLMFDQQLEEEAKCLNTFREIEAQLAEFLIARARELAFAKLDVPIFNVEQNVEFRTAMMEKEEHDRAHKEKEVDEETDFLAPYIIPYTLPMKYKEAQAARDKCLKEFKEMMVNRANNLYKQFEQMDEKLQDLRNYYAIERDNMTPEDETAHFAKVDNVVTIMRALQVRTNRHKELAAIRFKELEIYLYNHPLLQILKESPSSEHLLKVIPSTLP